MTSILKGISESIGVESSAISSDSDKGEAKSIGWADMSEHIVEYMLGGPSCCSAWRRVWCLCLGWRGRRRWFVWRRVARRVWCGLPRLFGVGLCLRWTRPPRERCRRYRRVMLLFRARLGSRGVTRCRWCLVLLGWRR